MPLALNQTRYWEHDCPECQFLGSIATRDTLVDLYAHPGDPALATVVARYSDKDHDNISGLVFAHGVNAELTVARLVAVERGILREEA
jgi:hypothetical protein